MGSRSCSRFKIDESKRARVSESCNNFFVPPLLRIPFYIAQEYRIPLSTLPRVPLALHSCLFLRATLELVSAGCLRPRVINCALWHHNNKSQIQEQRSTTRTHTHRGSITSFLDTIVVSGAHTCSLAPVEQVR